MAGMGDATMLLDRPPGAARSEMARFVAGLSANGRVEVADYKQLWTWSVDRPEEFWPALWDFFGVRSPARPVTFPTRSWRYPRCLTP